MPSGYKYYLEYKKKRVMPSMDRMDRAYEAAYYKEPVFTMRMKTSFGAMRTAPTSKDTSGPIDISKARYEAPHYSCRKRTCKMLQMPGQSTDSVPGPGTYKVPSTTYFDHPCLPCPGRAVLKGAPRYKDIKEMKGQLGHETPGPASYNVATLKKEFYNILEDCSATKKYSMRTKLKLGGAMRTQFTNVTSGPIEYRCSKAAEPKYSMRMRTCKMLQMPGQSTDGVPGPGTYKVPTTTNFDHPSAKMPGRAVMSKSARFKYVDIEDM